MLLSIITINYNNKDGLKKTIESVVTQSEADFEYIIIDGASTDGSAELIKEYAEHPEYGKKITQWISEPDTGIYNAMNKGIGKASGEYLHMLNSGDWYEKDALSHIFPKLKEEKPDALLCSMIFFKNNTIHNMELRYPNAINSGAILHQGLIYKSIFHKQFGLYDESYKLAADYDFCLRFMYNKTLSYTYVFEPCVNFQEGGLGGSTLAYKENKLIKNKYRITQTNNRKSLIVYIIKLFIPYGILLLLKKLKKT